MLTDLKNKELLDNFEKTMQMIEELKTINQRR